MFPILQIGPLAIQTPGLIILIGLWIGLGFSERNAKFHNENPDQIYSLVFIALAGAVLAARLGYVIMFPRIFFQNPTSLFSLNLGLFDLWSGSLGGVIVALLYGKRKKLPFWKTLDILSPGTAVVLIAISLANLAAGTGYGRSTNVPWAIYTWGEYRHPSQLYETGVSIWLLWLNWPGKRLSIHEEPGVQILISILVYAGTRLFLDAFRGDKLILPAGNAQTQIAFWLISAICLGLLGKKFRKVNAISQIDIEDKTD